MQQHGRYRVNDDCEDCQPCEQLNCRSISQRASCLFYADSPLLQAQNAAYAANHRRADARNPEQIYGWCARRICSLGGGRRLCHSLLVALSEFCLQETNPFGKLPRGFMGR